MTLKTFHFAGVSSMNVTLGVPRLKEIINASKQISTPIITAALTDGSNLQLARAAQAKIEKTTLGQVSCHIKEVYAEETKCYISIKLDMKALKKNKLTNIDNVSVRDNILKGMRGITRPAILRSLKNDNISLSISDSSKLRVYVPADKKQPRGGNSSSKAEEDSTNRGGKGKDPNVQSAVYSLMQQLKIELPKVVVSGYDEIVRAVIHDTKTGVEGVENTPTTPASEEANKNRFHLLVEGYGLLDVMGSEGVSANETTSNHIIEVEKVLGVEAARAKIQHEISYIMSMYGIGIDSRHLLLLSDVMTFKGEVLGITRFGVSKMRESVLMLAR